MTVDTSFFTGAVIQGKVYFARSPGIFAGEHRIKDRRDHDLYLSLRLRRILSRSV
jgi:hypothetical protein